MALNPFIRDTAYFQVLRDRGMMINAEDFDSQFNSLTDFINSRIVSAVNVFTGGGVVGEAGKEGYFLMNVGDGTTRWEPIGSNSMPDGSLSFDKLQNAAAGSILASGADRKFNKVTPTVDGTVLISQDNDLPAWKLIGPENIEDHTIPGSKIGFQQLRTEHFVPDFITSPLGDGAIETRHLVDSIIQGHHMADRCLPPEKIEAGILAQARINTLFGDGINRNVLRNRHFADKSIDYRFWFPAGKDIGGNDTHRITDNSVVYSGGHHIDPFLHFAAGTIFPYHIALQSYDIDSGHVGNVYHNLLTKEKLSPVIRQKLGI